MGIAALGNIFDIFTSYFLISLGRPQDQLSGGGEAEWDQPTLQTLVTKPLPLTTCLLFILAKAPSFLLRNTKHRKMTKSGKIPPNPRSLFSDML